MDHLPDDGTSDPAEKSDSQDHDRPVDASHSDSDPVEPNGPSGTTLVGENTSDAEWLRDGDFVDKGPNQPIEVPPRPYAERRLPGPGLPEAFLWVVGVLVVHWFGGAIAAVVVMIAEGVRAGTDDPQQVLHTMRDAMQDNLVPLMGGEMGIFVLCAVLACGLRLRPRVAARLGLHPLPMRHLLGLILLLPPLSFTCGQLYSWAMPLWEKIVDIAPQLKAFDVLNSTEMIKHVAAQASFPMMLFLVALLPAIGEELVFRGVIGRGLVARWGMVRGVLLTSLFFAAVHLHPVHALALLPLAVCLHLVYLATRSFWAPVVLHLLNNAWATVVLKSPRLETLPGAEVHQTIPPLLFAVAAVSALITATVIWRSRVRYVLPDGTFWTPGYDTVEVAPAHLHAVTECRRVEPSLLIAAVLGVAAFAGVLVQTIVS